MLMTKNRSKSGHAGAGEIAALHDDRGVEVALDRLGDFDVLDAWKGPERRGAGSALTSRTSFPSARSA